MSFRETNIPHKPHKLQTTSNPSFAPIASTASSSSWRRALRPLLDKAAKRKHKKITSELLRLWRRHTSVSKTAAVSE